MSFPLVSQFVFSTSAVSEVIRLSPHKHIKAASSSSCTQTHRHRVMVTVNGRLHSRAASGWS